MDVEYGEIDVKPATFVRRQPIVSYFALAYAISWAGSIVVLGPKFIRGEHYNFTETLLSLFIMLAGPSVAGIGLTRVVDGKQGIRELLSRMRQWQVSVGWYAVALLTTPFVLLAVLLLLSELVSPQFAPNFLLLGIAYGICAGYFEEIGWMGYAFPKLILKYNALIASLILGALHGIWHLTADYLGSVGHMGIYWLPHFLVQYVAAMTLTRILIVWVYTKTRSVLLAQLFHASSTGFLVALEPVAMTPLQATLADASYVAALFVMVTLLLVTNGKTLVQGAVYCQATSKAME